MKKSEKSVYSMFTGCLIPSKFPFIEKATRWVLGSFKITLHPIPGASCCPNQMAIQSSNKNLWYALAARNLCLAERQGHDILALCNGCYDTLKTTNTRLKNDPGFREKVNLILAKFDLSFEGTIDVKHLVQVLHDDIGISAIDRKTRVPLEGTFLAPFEGCHQKRPMDHLGFDDPFDPTYLQDIIKGIGAKPVPYPEHQSCCAGGLSIGRPHDVAPSAKRLLSSARASGARALVVNCPFCFAQFVRSQREIAEYDSDKIRMPVFYITELMGLAFGASEEELGLPLHYEISIGLEREFVHGIQGKAPPPELFDDVVTKSQLETCAQCLACCDDCPTAMTTSDYNPQEIIQLVKEGKIDEALRRDDIWFCMNCHECTTRCPQDFGMVKLIVRLKNLAARSGIYPEVVGHRISELHERGYSFPPDIEKRKELGLAEISMPEMDELRKFMKKAGSDSEKDGD